jgi:hypothetical protein
LIVMRRTSAEGITNHDERRSQYRRKRRRRCATGRHSRAGESLLEEGCQPEAGRAQAPEDRQGQVTPKKAPKPNKKAAKPAHAKQAATPHADSKVAKILALIGRPKGATLTEIRTATDWQAHSVRGFISTASKKHKFNIESSKNEAGDRVYQIKK